MVILQSHRTQNMILRCYPNVTDILRRHTKSCFLWFFNNPLYFLLLIHRIFYLLVSALFFTYFAVLEEIFQVGALLRQKNGYLVWSRGASSVRTRRAQAQNIAAA